jgi:uncharacterized iron-regulated membrane protein
MTRRTAAGYAPLSAVFQSLRSAFPGYQTQRIVWPQKPGDVYFAHMANAKGEALYASVDPGDAHILKSGGLWAFPMEALLAVHLRLLTGKVGLSVVFLGALSILAQAVSGWAYWWPKKGRFWNAAKINWKLPPRIVLRHLHRSGGLVISIIAATSAVTGGLVAAEYLWEPGPLTSTAPSHGAVTAVAGVDQAFAAARAAHPTQGLRDIRMPQPGALNACFWATRRSALAVDIVKTQLPQGRVASMRPAEDDDSLWVTLLPIHNGEAFGLAGRLILLVGGLGLAALAVTGPIMWLQKKAKP